MINIKIYSIYIQNNIKFLLIIIIIKQNIKEFFFYYVN